MIRHKFNKLICLLALLFLAQYALADVEYTPLAGGKELKNETIASTGTYKYYKFKVESDFNGLKDITIKTALTEEHPWANPDIYLAKDSKTPNSTHYQIACQKFGEDICTINKQEIKADEEWYVGITCGPSQVRDQACQYDIVLEYVEEMILEDGVPLTIFLYEDEERIFRYFVPDDSEIRHVQISARGKDVFSKFQLLTVKGNDPPGTDRRSHSWPAWNNGYVSRFEPGCDCFCVNCNYTAMIQADTTGYYTITAKTSKVVETIKNGEIYDTVFRGRNNCYEYYMSDPESDMRVKMKVYSGDPDLFVHPKTLPLYLNQFKYNSFEAMESEELIITKKMREDDENVVGIYSICVLGKVSSSFKLEIKNQDNSDHMLEAGLGESGYLDKGEVVNYWYREDILKQKTNITLQMHAMSGSNTMRHKFCSAERDIEKSKLQCAHTSEDLLRPEENEQNFINIGKEFIQHDPSTCNGGNPIMKMIRYEPPTCMYNIGIIGTAEGKNHYGVTLRHQEGHHVLLAEGKTTESSLTQGQFEYFKVSINDDTITSLTIQLLSIHGDADMYLSQKDEFPTNEKFERQATICGKFPDTIFFTTDNNQTASLTGDYYIGVYGFTESSFHLYYHTERTDKDKDGKEEKIKLPVSLQQSKPVRGILKSKDDYLLYKFNIANATNEEEIVLRLTPENGKFKYSVKFGEDASKTVFDKVGSLDNHYTVVFNPVKEPQFKQGEFRIYVYPVGTTDLEESGMSYTFLLNYYIGSHHIPLMNDQPTLGFMSDQKINYYSYAFRTEIDEIKLTVTKLAGNVEVVVSLNQTITFPLWQDINPEDGVYTSNAEKNTFSKAKIESFCKHDDFGYCIMTIGVRSTILDAESQYILTAKSVKKDETPITKIENGMPQHGSVKPEQWQYFYYKTSESQPVTAVVVPNGGDPNIYVSLVSDLSLSESEWERPTTTKHLKKSEDSIGADIVIITKDELKNCSSSCVLVFGVQARSSNSAFTLTVTRGMLMLKENQAFSDSLGAWGNYKFYEYYKTCSNCTTVISINSLVDKAFSVFANFNTTEKIVSHQDRGMSDFELNARGDGKLIITPADFKAKGYKDAPGYFLLEVHSHSNLNYTITVASNEGTITPLSKGLPNSFNVPDAENSEYFVYRHDSSKGFFIHIQEEFGFVETLVNAVPDTISVNEKLPKDQTHSQWSTYQTNDRNYLEITNKDANFCTKCSYVIKVESNTGSKGQITIQETGKQTNVNQMTVLRLGKPVSATIQSTGFIHYKFLVPDDKPLKIDVVALSGEIEFEITSEVPVEKDFGAAKNDRKTTLIHNGDNSSKAYVFNDDHSQFNSNKMFYLTVKSKDFYSSVVITVGHIGDYSLISETTPQSVTIDDTISMFYYFIEPSLGKAKITLETFPENKKEKYDVFIKIVDKEDVIDASKESLAPSWQLTAEEVISQTDKAISFNLEKKQATTSLHLDVNQDANDKDKVILIAIKATSKDPLKSKVDIYIAASHVQPLTFGRSYFGTVENKKDVYKIYEVFVPHLDNETYVVDLMPCYGKAEMYIGHGFAQLLKGNYMSLTSQLTNGRLSAVLENKRNQPRKYIIAVKSLNEPMTGEEETFAYTEFKIEARKYPSEIAKNAYHQKYFIPKEGEIDWEFSDDGKIQVSWPKIYNIEGSQELPSDEVTYDVFMRKEDVLGLESPCSMETHFTPLNTEPIVGNSYIIDMDTQELDETNNVYINVLAHINHAESKNVGEYPMTFRPLKIHMENLESDDEIGLLVWIITAAIILILALALICIYRRYKRVSYKLKTQVREVGRPDFGEEMKEKKVYNKFADQEITYQ